MYSYWAYGGSQGGPGGPGGGGPGGGPGGGNSGGGMMMPQGPQGDLFLVMNEDGTVKYVTDDSSDPAIIMDSVKPAGWAGHSYFYTNYSSNQTMDVEYERKTYTFTLKQPNMLNHLSSPSTDIKMSSRISSDYRRALFRPHECRLGILPERFGGYRMAGYRQRHMGS